VQEIPGFRPDRDCPGSASRPSREGSTDRLARAIPRTVRSFSSRRAKRSPAGTALATVAVVGPGRSSPSSRVCRFFVPSRSAPPQSATPDRDPRSPGRAVRSRLALTVALAAPVLLAVAPSCGGRGGQRPAATLSSSTAAQVAFAPIRDAWSAQSRSGRAQLREPLERFLTMYPSDGAAPLARTYLVFILLDVGEGARADRFLRQLEQTVPPGATRDLVTIARAKHDRTIMRRAGVAFEHIRPLVGKVVDPASRALLQEEVSLSAIESQRDYEAIAYMDAWLANAGEEERDGVRVKVSEALARLPQSVLEGALRAMRARGTSSGYGREIQRLVSERLAAIAVASGDPDLARWLLDPNAGTALLGGSALGELATSHRGANSVDARTVGLVLPSASNELRDEAADVMRGVAWALDLPRRDTSDTSAGDRTRLSIRDDGGDPARVAATMEELAGEGAAVILAALEPLSAERAVQWSEAHGVPVIVLSVPPQEIAKDFAFVVGEPRRTELAALMAALRARGITRAATVVATEPGVPLVGAPGLELLPPVDCKVDPEHAGDARFPVAEWKRGRVRGWLIDGPTECARDVIAEIASAGLPSGGGGGGGGGGGSGGDAAVAVTLDGADTRARAARIRVLVASAGIIPRAAVKDPERDADLERFIARRGGAPSWWTALGRDAAALARSAIANLPLDATSDAAEVARRRAAVKAGIASARLHLWTTDAAGMEGGRVLGREVRVIEVGGVKR
jgi:hypothetical protein